MVRLPSMVPAALVALAAAPTTAQAPQRAISHIAGDLCRFQNDFHYSVFLVTDEGILVTDPINADAARWLKGQLAERFPDQRVRYQLEEFSHLGQYDARREPHIEGMYLQIALYRRGN